MFCAYHHSTASFVHSAGAQAVNWHKAVCLEYRGPVFGPLFVDVMGTALIRMAAEKMMTGARRVRSRMNPLARSAGRCSATSREMARSKRSSTGGGLERSAARKQSPGISSWLRLT